MQNYLWNYGDYYTRDKSREYNKRLIAVGPQNKRESIGYRFCTDYYLDIDESDLITKLFRAVSYVNSTRTDDYFYSALNEEVTIINGDINNCIKFIKEFCNRHNIKYNSLIRYMTMALFTVYVKIRQNVILYLIYLTTNI